METRRTGRVALKFQSMLKESSVLFGRGSRQGVVDGYSYLRCCSRRSPAWLPSYLTIQCVQNFQCSSLRPPVSRSRSKRLPIAADAVSIHRSTCIECIDCPAPVPQLSLVLCQQSCGSAGRDACKMVQTAMATCFFLPFCMQWTMKRADDTLRSNRSRLSWNTVA